jgi:hypothetical protein
VEFQLDLKRVRGSTQTRFHIGIRFTRSQVFLGLALVNFC